MKKSIFIILLFFYALSISANNEQLLRRIDRKYQNFRTFEASIVQENFFSQINYTLSSTGNVYMQGESVVIEYNQPNYQFIKMINNEITIFSQLENTAIITQDSSLFTQALLQFSNILNNDLKFIEQNNNIVIFEVLKLPVSTIQNMRLYINERNDLIEKVSYNENSNNTVTIEFNNQKFNQTLSRPLNSFILPEGVIIIRN